MKGPVFGRYEVDLKLASGGMGDVYLAREVSTEQHVILKVLRQDLIRDQQVVLQFLDEVRISAQLHHTNVVSVFDVGEWQGEVVMAMEYIPGHDCATLLKQAQARMISEVPVPVAAQILLHAAQGLAYVHGATDLKGQPLKVVHRDISPQNLMVREDGVTKILDFGVARAEARIVRTMQGVVKGKLSYMAPEQVRGTEITGKVDQFALGVVAWELLTVQRLFRGNSDIDTLNLVMEKPIAPPSTFANLVPRGLDDVVLRMLERNPEHRFAGCAQAARALEPFAGGPQAVVAFRKSLGLPNPSDRFKSQSVITESRAAVAPPRASPVPPRATPATTRQRLPRPRSVPPLPAAVPSRDLASAKGTEEHEAMNDLRPPQATRPAPTLVDLTPAGGAAKAAPVGRRQTGERPAAEGPSHSTFKLGPERPTDPHAAALSSPRPESFITEPQGRPLRREASTDGGAIAERDEAHTISAVEGGHRPRPRWWLMALAGLAALALGAGSALAVIKMILDR